MGGVCSFPQLWIKRVRSRQARKRANADKDTCEDTNIHNDKIHEFKTGVFEEPELALEVLSNESKKEEEKINAVTSPVLPPIVGVPPPPPPPPPAQGSTDNLELPHGLVKKKKIKVTKKLANPRWKNVDVNKMPKEAIWVKQGDKCMSAHTDYLVNSLTRKFPQSSKSLKVQEPNRNMMDNQLCLKLKIFKNTTKTSDSKKILSHILRCDEHFLTSEMLQQLKNLLPKEGANNFLDVPSSSFLSPIFKISRLSERIDVLLFKLDHEESSKENLEGFLNDIKIVRKACQELKQSKSLEKIFSLILQIGNVLKSSSDGQLSYGFHISYLTKLKDIKQENQRLSLLDFVVEAVSEKFPACLEMQDEIPTIVHASCISFMKITDWLDQQRCGLQRVEIEIKEAASALQEDKLKEVLIPFAKEVAKKIATLGNAMSKMEKEFLEINQYFVHTHEDKEIDPCMEFFGYFKTFQEQYLNSIKSKR